MSTELPTSWDELRRAAFIADLVSDIRKWKAVSREGFRPVTAIIAEAYAYRLYASLQIYEEGPEKIPEIQAQYPNLDEEILELSTYLGERGEFREGLFAYELILQGHTVEQANALANEAAASIRKG